ncbi:MAG: hypothetical protein M1828_001127 [Chrysothrix sp. TS-e1954]|nr:MAG: hypothetical protein M1828_001127 [Chrysothrix sp. TS-e1954]
MTMASEIERVPKTSLYFLQHDAPSLMPLYATQPEICIIFPSSPDYAKYHFEYNTKITTIPMAIVLPADTEQLISVLKHCASQSPPISTTVRGGGHDYHGRNVMAGAVQLDLRLMKWINVFRLQESTVTVGAGCTSIELERKLSLHGLATPLGWVGSVGVIGWACGGGYGLEAGKWGLGVDNVIGAKLVTPTGEEIDTDSDSELLWALRGAGLGNFGVISELRLKAYESPRYLAGLVTFPLAEGQQILSGFERLCEADALPRNFSGELTIAQVQGKPAITFLFAWISEKGEDVAEGWVFLKRLKSLGMVLSDTVAEISVLRWHEMMHDNPAFNPTGYTTIYALAVPSLAPDLVEAITKRPPPLTSAVLVHHAHGRATQQNLEAAWALRDRHYILTFVGFAVPDASPDLQLQAQNWAKDLYQASLDTGVGLQKSYWSLARPEHCNPVKFFGQDTVDRLIHLKKKYNALNLLPAASPDLSE